MRASHEMDRRIKIDTFVEALVERFFDPSSSEFDEVTSFVHSNLKHHQFPDANERSLRTNYCSLVALIKLRSIHSKANALLSLLNKLCINVGTHGWGWNPTHGGVTNGLQALAMLYWLSDGNRIISEEIPWLHFLSIHPADRQHEEATPLYVPEEKQAVSRVSWGLSDTDEEDLQDLSESEDERTEREAEGQKSPRKEPTADESIGHADGTTARHTIISPVQYHALLDRASLPRSNQSVSASSRSVSRRQVHPATTLSSFGSIVEGATRRVSLLEELATCLREMSALPATLASLGEGLHFEVLTLRRMLDGHVDMDEQVGDCESLRAARHFWGSHGLLRRLFHLEQVAACLQNNEKVEAHMRQCKMHSRQDQKVHKQRHQQQLGGSAPRGLPPLSNAESVAAAFDFLLTSYKKEQQLGSKGRLASMWLHLFLRLLVPYLRLLHAWLTQGVLVDAHGELFLQASQTERADAASAAALSAPSAPGGRHEHQCHELRRESAIPAALRGLAREVLRAGEAQRLLVILHQREQRLQGRLPFRGKVRASPPLDLSELRECMSLIGDACRNQTKLAELQALPDPSFPDRPTFFLVPSRFPPAHHITQARLYSTGEDVRRRSLQLGSSSARDRGVRGRVVSEYEDLKLVAEIVENQIQRYAIRSLGCKLAASSSEPATRGRLQAGPTPSAKVAPMASTLLNTILAAPLQSCCKVADLELLLAVSRTEHPHRIAHFLISIYLFGDTTLVPADMYDPLFSALACGAYWKDTLLEMQLQMRRAARRLGLKTSFEANISLTFDVPDQPHVVGDPLTNIQIFRFLHVSIADTWLVQSLFSPDALILLDKVWGFLLQLRRSIWALANVESVELNRTIMHRFLMLRSELLHFIRGVYFHCSCVIQHERSRWDRSFSSMSSIQDFRDSFESLAGRILKRCFLEPRFRPIHQRVLQLLGSALKLRLQFDSIGNHQMWQPANSAQHWERDVRQQIKLFLKAVQAVQSDSTHGDELQNLCGQINLNGFYSRRLPIAGTQDT